jgi:hypothetical protein
MASRWKRRVLGVRHQRIVVDHDTVVTRMDPRINPVRASPRGGRSTMTTRRIVSQRP